MYLTELSIARDLAAQHRAHLLSDADRLRARPSTRAFCRVSVRLPAVRRRVGLVLVRVGERLEGAPAA